MNNKDAFFKNVLIVFTGLFSGNFLNLLFQLLIAHKLSPSDFGAFNSLLSIFLLVFTPASTIQYVVAKYSAQYYSNQQTSKLKFFLSDFTVKTLISAAAVFFVFSAAIGSILNGLKISCPPAAYIFPAAISFACIIPVFLGAVQGLERFAWVSTQPVVTGSSKLIVAFVLITLGFNIAGALSALVVSNLITVFILYIPLRNLISFSGAKEDIDYKEILNFLYPVALSSFCYIGLVSMDMIMAKHFFTSESAGLYSLSQMVGKIFLFLPGAISIVMFPKVSGLNAKNLDTSVTLKKSLLYGYILCAAAILIYNVFPAFILTVLTGKVFPESIVLGRLFSFSMSFFALLFILITYFLSIKDMRFIKYLICSVFLQFAALMLFHRDVFQVQIVLCVNSCLTFGTLLLLSRKRIA